MWPLHHPHCPQVAGAYILGKYWESRAVASFHQEVSGRGGAELVNALKLQMELSVAAFVLVCLLSVVTGFMVARVLGRSSLSTSSRHKKEEGKQHKEEKEEKEEEE